MMQAQQWSLQDKGLLNINKTQIQRQGWGTEVNSDVLATILCDWSVKQPQLFEPKGTGSPKSRKTFWGGS